MTVTIDYLTNRLQYINRCSTNHVLSMWLDTLWCATWCQSLNFYSVLCEVNL